MSNSGLGYTIFDPRATFLTYLTPTKVLSHKIDAVPGWTEADVREWVIAVWGNQTDDWIDQLNDWLTGGIAAPGNIRIDPGNLLLEASSPEARVGDGTGDPRIVLNKGAANTGYVSWEDASVERWRGWAIDAAEQLLAKRYDAGGVFQGDTITLTTAGNVLLEADLTLNSASPTLNEGTGTGGPTAELDAAVANGSNYRFRMAGLITWDLRNVATTKDWALRRYDAGGSALDNPAAFAFATGSATYTASATYASASPTLAVGDGTGSPVVQFNKSDAGTGDLRWQKVGARDWVLQDDASENFRLNRYIADVFQSATLTVENANGRSTWAGDLIAYSDPSVQLLVGSPGTGSPSIRFLKSDAGVATISFGVVATNRSAIRLNASEDMTFEAFDAGGSLTSTATWGNNGNWTYPANGSYSSASPNVQVGNGTGLPQFIVNSADASEGQVVFRSVGTTRVAIRRGATNSNLILDLRDAGGAITSTSTWANGSGLWTYPASATYLSASPTLTVGDGTGTPIVAINKEAAGVAYLLYRNVGVTRARVALDTSLNLLFQVADSGGATQATTSMAAVTGAWTHPNNLTLNSASPVLTLGNSTGSPRIILQKEDAVEANIRFLNGGVQRWYLNFIASESLVVQRFDATGVLVGSLITLDQSNGNVTIATLSGNLVTLSDANIQLLLGAGTGSPNIRFLKSDAGAADINFGVVATNRSTIRLNASEDMEFIARDSGGAATSTTTWGNNGSWTYPASSTWSSASPSVIIGNTGGAPLLRLTGAVASDVQIRYQAGGVSLWDLRQAATSGDFLLRRYVAGVGTDNPLSVASASGNITYSGSAFYGSASPVLQIGSNAGTPILRLYGTDTSKPALQFGDASDDDVAWLAYDHNNARFEWRVEATVKVYLDSVAFAPPSANWLNLGTAAFPFGILYADALNPSVQVVVDTTANVGDMSIVTADDAGSTTPRDLDLPDPAPTGRVILIYVLRVPTGAGGFSLDPQTKNINGAAAKKLLASNGLYILSAVDASNWLLTGPQAFS